MSSDSILDSSSVGGASGRWYDIEPEGSSSSSSSSSRKSGTFAGPHSESKNIRDIWLGMKYVESVIAEKVHSKASALDSGITLESKSKDVLHGFPFDRCCAFLHLNGVGGHYESNNMAINHHDILFSWVGQVIHQGTQPQRTLVYEAIISFSTTMFSPPIAPQKRRAATEHGLFQQCQPALNANADLSRQLDLALYTQLLYRFATHHQEELIYVERDERTNSTDGSARVCRIKYRGATGEGRGPQKKSAKHQASFEVCHKLGIGLEWDPLR